MSSKTYETKKARISVAGKEIKPIDDITIQVGLQRCECYDCKLIREAITNMRGVLDRDNCRETQCPAPCRAVCSNPTHQAIRRNISHLTTLLSAHQSVVTSK
jgi:hypothetical protein